jgi:uncharacterized protein (TIGR02145 family)
MKNKWISILILVMIVGCKGEISNPIVEPGLSDISLSIVNDSTVIIIAKIIDNGGSTIIKKGICWSELPSPTLQSHIIIDSTLTQEINCKIPYIRPGKIYYFKAFAINSVGVGYAMSNTKSFFIPFNRAELEITKVENLTSEGFKCCISIKTDGDIKLLDKGICFSRHISPTIDDDTQSSGDKLENYETTINQLKEGTAYFVRPYANTNRGYFYGKNYSLVLPDKNNKWDIKYDATIDIDGNIYKTIKIGNQTWMADNLRTTSYQNGDHIPYAQLREDWIAPFGAQCTYRFTNDWDNIIRFGRLYNRLTIYDNRNIAPLGWHVSTSKDWELLEQFIIQNNNSALNPTSLVQSLCSQKLWDSSNKVGTPGWDKTTNNSTGFNAIPARVRTENPDYEWIDNTECTYFMTIESDNELITKYKQIYLTSDTLIYTFNTDFSLGASIRCVKN